MKRWLINNLSTLWVSISTLIYGIMMAFSWTNSRILEPPGRYILIGSLIVLPIILMVLTYTSHNNMRGWCIIAISVVWVWISILYTLHPLNNGGWILALSQVGYSFILLFRGDFSD